MKFVITVPDGRDIELYGARPGNTYYFSALRAYGRIERETQNNYRRKYSNTLEALKPQGKSFLLDDIKWEDGMIVFHHYDLKNRWLTEPNTEYAEAYPYWLGYAGTQVPYPFTIYAKRATSSRELRRSVLETLKVSHTFYEVFKVEGFTISYYTNSNLPAFNVTKYADRWDFDSLFLALERPVKTVALDYTRIFFSKKPFGFSCCTTDECFCKEATAVMIEKERV